MNIYVKNIKNIYVKKKNRYRWTCLQKQKQTHRTWAQGSQRAGQMGFKLHAHTAMFKTDDPQETAVTTEVFLTEKTVSIFFFYNFRLNYVHNFSTETTFGNNLTSSICTPQQSRGGSSRRGPVPSWARVWLSQDLFADCCSWFCIAALISSAFKHWSSKTGSHIFLQLLQLKIWFTLFFWNRLQGNIQCATIPHPLGSPKARSPRPGKQGAETKQQRDPPTLLVGDRAGKLL